jgi:hypothetical protein
MLDTLPAGVLTAIAAHVGSAGHNTHNKNYPETGLVGPSFACRAAFGEAFGSRETSHETIDPALVAPMRLACRAFRDAADAPQNRKVLVCCRSFSGPSGESNVEDDEKLDEENEGKAVANRLLSYLTVVGFATPLENLDLSFLHPVTIDLLLQSGVLERNCPALAHIAMQFVFPRGYFYSRPGLGGLDLSPLCQIAPLRSLDLSCREGLEDMFRWRSFPRQLTAFAWRGRCPQSLNPLLLEPDTNPLSGDDDGGNGDQPLALRVLDMTQYLHRNGWNDTVILPVDELARFAARCPSIRAVSLAGIERPQSIVEALGRTCPDLSFMDVTRCGLSTSEVMQLIPTRAADLQVVGATPTSPTAEEGRRLAADLRRWAEEFCARPDVVGRVRFGPPFKAGVRGGLAPGLPDDIKAFFLEFGSFRLRWHLKGTEVERFDQQSRGGCASFSAPRGGTHITETYLNIDFAKNDVYYFDNHVAEGNGALVRDKQSEEWHVSWETSSSTPRFGKPLMTFQEYVRSGMDAAFSWYWPVHEENIWILQRLHRGSDSVSPWQATTPNETSDSAIPDEASEGQSN